MIINTNILLLCVLCIFIIKLHMLIYFTPVTNFPVFYGPKLHYFKITYTEKTTNDRLDSVRLCTNDSDNPNQTTVWRFGTTSVTYFRTRWFSSAGQKKWIADSESTPQKTFKKRKRRFFLYVHKVK